MINPKYDPSNYLKHLAVAVITDNQKINQLFGSYLLRVRWWHDNPKLLPQSDLIGTLRIHTETPFGALEPKDYQFKISSHKQIYVQFLTIPIPEFEYKIEVIHPVGLTRSKIEIWEYIRPITYNTSQVNPMAIHQPQATQNNDALIAAINAGTAAEIASNAPEILQTQTATIGGTLLPQLISVGNNTRRSLMFSTSNPGMKYRFYADMPTGFADPNYMVELDGANAQWEVPEGHCQSPFYLACDIDGVPTVTDLVATETVVASGAADPAS
jgi:hypothetical protein